MKIIIALALAATLSACSLPVTETKTGVVRPTLAIQGAPAGAVLYVDGLAMGDAAQYNGNEKRLFIEEGVHQVEVHLNGTVLIAQRLLASGGETSTVVVRGESGK